MDNITSQDNNLYRSQTKIKSSHAALISKCMGKGCRKLGRTFLKINYVNKVGYFCETCAEDLISEELAVEEVNLSLD
jgi:hypothetical protein